MTSYPLFWLCLVALVLFSLLFTMVPLIKNEQMSKIKKSAVFALMLCAPLGLYRYWGASDNFIHVKAYKTISKCLENLSSRKNLDLDQVMPALAELKNEINDSHEGLARLAGIYTEVGKYNEAISTLEEAMSMAPEKDEYALQWIYHQAFVNQGKLPEKARAKAMGLLTNPDTRQAAMNMIAMDDYFKGNYGSAIQYWEEILETDKNLTDERRQVLEKALMNAKGELNNEHNEKTASIR